MTTKSANKIPFIQTNNILDTSNPTKQLSIDMSNISNDQTIVMSYPNSNFKVVGETNSQTIINKNITDSSNNVSAKNIISSNNTQISINTSTPTYKDQVLVTTNATTSTWQSVMKYIGDWNSTFTYASQNVVVYNNSTWVSSVNDNLNNIPSPSSLVWKEITGTGTTAELTKITTVDTMYGQNITNGRLYEFQPFLGSETIRQWKAQSGSVNPYLLFLNHTAYQNNNGGSSSSPVSVTVSSTNYYTATERLQINTRRGNSSMSGFYDSTRRYYLSTVSNPNAGFYYVVRFGIPSNIQGNGDTAFFVGLTSTLSSSTSKHQDWANMIGLLYDNSPNNPNDKTKIYIVTSGNTNSSGSNMLYFDTGMVLSSTVPSPVPTNFFKTATMYELRLYSPSPLVKNLPDVYWFIKELPSGSTFSGNISSFGTATAARLPSNFMSTHISINNLNRGTGGSNGSNQAYLEVAYQYIETSY